MEWKNFLNNFSGSIWGPVKVFLIGILSSDLKTYSTFNWMSNNVQMRIWDKMLSTK